MGFSRKRLLVIGIDQAIPCILNKFNKEGVLPNIRKLIESGVSCEALPCAPCDTPTNWATIATGATAAIHGATSFYMHLTGDSLNNGLNYRSRTQLTRYCKAEYIWDVADNAGYTPFVTNYPAGWPSNFKKGAMSLFTWPIPESFPRMLLPSSTHNFNSNLDNISNRLLRVESSKHAKDNAQLLKATLYIKSKEIKKQKLIEIYLKDSKDRGYDTIQFSKKYNDESELSREKLWSDWIQKDVITDYGVLPCLFRLKVLNFDPKGDNFKVKLSAIFNIKGWTTPESFGKALVKNVFKYDLPKRQEIRFMIYGSLDNFLSSARQESLTLAKSIKFAYKMLNWDFCFFHYHHLDSINHTLLASVDNKSPNYTEEREEEAWEYIKEMYIIVDQLVEKLINSCVDDNTIILFISDHGAVPIWRIIDIPLIFAKSGLINYKYDNRKKKYVIDWNKTVAFPYMEPPFIWVNLKNRDPNGIVSQNKYEDVRDDIIETLIKVKDPSTNQSIIQSALKKEETENLGLNGDRIGDLIYFLKPPYGIFDGNLNSINASILPQNYLTKLEVSNSQKFFGAHAYYLPSTKFNNFSVSAPFIMSGPGIKKGIMLKKLINLIDIAPTLSYILEIPKPKNSIGEVLYDVLE
ncbi:MAG: alkaline phosphatase family protein [Promethearchaeota archaeon]